MNFSEVLSDIKKLSGLELQSIKTGANIKILEVDEEKNNMLIETSRHQVKSRPLGELEIIWNEMAKNPAVHVEGVLHGSGTSRNQPETILANLPYVEWLKVDNKKHIAYVGSNTHAYGTLKRMDAFAAANIAGKMQNPGKSKDISSIIVSDDINRSVSTMNSICQGTISCIAQGMYRYETKTDYIIFLSSDVTGLANGTYCVLEPMGVPYAAKKIEIDDTEYSVVDQDGLKAFLKRKQ